MDDLNEEGEVCVMFSGVKLLHFWLDTSCPIIYSF